MSTAVWHTVGIGQFALTGSLDFSSVPDLLPQGLRAFGDTACLSLDLGGVTHANSAGLVLLLEWLAQTKRQGQTLHLTRLPAALLALAAVSQCSALLESAHAPINAATACESGVIS